MAETPEGPIQLIYQLDHLNPLYATTRHWFSENVDGSPLIFYQPEPLEDLAYNRLETVSTHVIRGTVNPAKELPLDKLQERDRGIQNDQYNLYHISRDDRWLGAIETEEDLTEEVLDELTLIGQFLELGAQFHFHQNRSDFNEWLLNLHRSLIGPEDFEGLLNHLFDGLEQKLQVDQIGYYSDRGDNFELILSRGFPDKKFENRRLVAREQLLEEGMGEESFVTLEINSDTGLFMPLETGEQLVGVLGFFDPPWQSDPSNHLLYRLEAVKTMAALVIHSFHLQHTPEESVIHDQLTNLQTPEYFSRRLEQEITRGKRYGPPCSIMVLDVDHFASINQELGYKAGENTLRELARLMQNSFRTIDLACRFDNDQFAVMFPNTSLEESLTAARRFQELAREPFLQFRGDQIGIRFSAGMASFPEDGESVEELFKQAKLALYEAKQTGKDRVVTARNL